MQYYGYEMFREDIKELVSQIDFNPDAIVAISRGGLTMAHFLGIALDLRRVYTINASSFFNKVQQRIQISNIPELNGNQRILIVDEIVDSGTSMEKVYTILKTIYSHIDFKTACIFHKPTANFKPDFIVREAKDWVEFFWEVDIVKSMRERQ
ncbi:phosphoribosyltransferase [Helicobacter turcicus]|uniref:Phosphoribosyltransferase domain-containing protein n=1 Tax=Helicobacter turcicus TaxID=2867412 RepID=A0ABS7JKR2_9HELI|nr:phosphoribosyltransferase family protein [Helicobacter turcicus]MBX7489976.1 phosphoribosyltransferase domain-containing protein [Helicobacter turcicus]MBX7544835.1 phosphoribosyltransferase domain-containing protein [Helicobacter turcicus]